MSDKQQRQDRITDEAALWFVRAQDLDLSEADRAEFATWLMASAEHVGEYLSLAAIPYDIRELTIDSTVDELLELARKSAEGSNIVTLFGDSHWISDTDALPAARDSLNEKPLKSAWRRPARWAYAASLVILSSAALFFTTPEPIVFSTGVGEQMSFPLKDGSVVTLNAQSTLEVLFTDAQRRIHLHKGEALFDVKKNAEIPFLVLSNRTEIEAIGTSFNVRFRGADTRVTVVEGVVDVRSVNEQSQEPQSNRLTIGRQATVAAGEIAVADIDIEKAMSWRKRRLSFDAWGLESVVAEFNLYNDHPIVIQDNALKRQSISGSFNADDRASFVLFLSQAGLAQAHTQTDGTIVLSQRSLK